MLVLLDSNILWSALISPKGPPRRIYGAWLAGRFELLTCPQQIAEIRSASRYPKFREILQPHRVGVMINNLYRATVWEEPLPQKHEAADPEDSYLLNLIEAAKPDYAVTGDKQSGILAVRKLGRTSIWTARDFCEQILRI